MSVPNSVRNATFAVWAILGLAVLRVILTMAFKDDLLDAWLADTGRTYPARELAEDAAPQYTGVAIVTLVITALLGFAALNLPKGANWARIVAVVFAALSVLGIGAAFVVASLPVLVVINVLIALLSVAVIVLLFTADANRFFAARARLAG
ncbi:DUF7144 family membrane protein [Actinophytocola sp.]|uniref:DUF7144 family membrane protein n=1 Tax=Actinophytocola sp. TaxID=1872138 RepID=UPI002D7E3356|nr:hypothetical protein [Actinophytocola sp.]HET9140177.1 hypothetical protein [Actinophytocola sp.]